MQALSTLRRWCQVTGEAVLLCPTDRTDGTELGPAYLLPVAGKPLVVHAVEMLRASGLRRIVLVADQREHPALRVLLGDGGARGATVELHPDGTVGPGWVRDLGDDGRDVLLMSGDAFLHEPVAELLAPTPAGVDAGFVSRAGERFDDLASGAVLGVLRHPALVELAAADGGSAPTRLADVVRALAERQVSVDLRGSRAAWGWAGHPDELLALNRALLDRMAVAPVDCQMADGSVFQGRVTIDPAADVRNSLVRGPVVIGGAASVVDAYVGPYTSISDGARVEGAEIENSILMPGAVVEYVGRRLEGSIIGTCATVTRTFHLPAALRLRIGTDASISLS
jgi:glucose-1-phosphate thymidylyltransferase